MTTRDDLMDRLSRRQATIGIIGLGYVGLPLCVAITRSGSRVVGFDIDPAKTVRLSRGESYIKHIPSSTIQEMTEPGRFAATSDFSRLKDVDAILICVPTPLTAHLEPDLSFVVSTTEEIARSLRRGQLVVLESTTYPGTTREVLRPILEESGLACGSDFFLAFSPEREDPGNPNFSTTQIPKVVGGDDPDSQALAMALYDGFVAKTVPVSSAATAEAVKITENIFRAVNIALVNELKQIYSKMGVDIWEVIDAAKTKPFGFQAFYPGPGLGGHCIPIDPFYLTWAAREYGLHTRFIELAGEVNTAMPHYVVQRVIESLNDLGKTIRGARVLALGAAYKPNVDDCRESPFFEIMELLQERGAVVAYNDPHIPVLPPRRNYSVRLESQPLTVEVLAAQDCVLILTDHSAYDYEFIIRHSPLLIDTRGATRHISVQGERIIRA